MRYLSLFFLLACNTETQTDQNLLVKYRWYHVEPSDEMPLDTKCWVPWMGGDPICHFPDESCY